MATLFQRLGGLFGKSPEVTVERPVIESPREYNTRRRELISQGAMRVELPWRTIDFNVNLGVRFEITDTGFMSHSKPWTHDILLGGASPKEAYEFTEQLYLSLKSGESSKNASYQESLDELFNSIAQAIFPRHEFWSPAFRIHELRLKAPHASTGEGVKASVEYALLTGAPLEFGYRSERAHKEGSRPEIHVRRVKVLKLHEDAGYFQACHARGIRNYRLEQVHWALAEEFKGSTMLMPEPLIKLRLTPKFDELHTLIALGIQGDRGTLVGPEGAIEPDSFELKRKRVNHR